MTTDRINYGHARFPWLHNAMITSEKKPYANKLPRPGVLLAHTRDSLGFSRITTASHMHKHLFEQPPERRLR